MDIRSYFSPTSEQKRSKPKPAKITIDDDDDDFKDTSASKRPAANSKRNTKTGSKSRRRTKRRLSDDSDSNSDKEVPAEKRSKSKSVNTPTRSSPRKASASRKKTPSKPPTSKNVPSASAFFGSAPIKRTEVKKPPVEKKKETKPTVLEKKESKPAEEKHKKVESKRKRVSPDEDLYEIPESPLDVVEFDLEIEKALKEESSKKEKEAEVHNNERFGKTLSSIDQEETEQLAKPPVKKLKLMMERVPLSRSPSKTPTATPTKQEPPPHKSTPSLKKKEKFSAVKKRLLKKPIQYEDYDDDDIITVASTPSNPPSQVSSQDSKSPAKQNRSNTPKLLKSPTPTLSKTPSSSRKTASPAKSVSPSTAHVTPKPTRSDSYRQYLNRGGPKALGSKPIPEGEEGCLDRLTFVITGVLESLERDQAAELVKKYGGKVTVSVSGKTSYLVVGEEAGQSKLAKAEQHGTKQIDEDGLLDLIRTRPGRSSKPAAVPAKKKPPAKRKSSTPPKKPQPASPPSKIEKPAVPSVGVSSVGVPSVGMSSVGVSGLGGSKTTEKSKKEPESLLWVDKYRPKSTKFIVGQSGEKSNAKKLAKWLINWENNHLKGGETKRPVNRFHDDGSSYKAALLSGPPGIGKTTTATLVCEENGYSYIEMNASAKRNKAALQGEVAANLTSLSIDSFMGGGVAKSKHVLIMDEVDGMAGNEDRGGMQELIAMIKTSKIPIICICNDRQSTKVRSLANHCYDLRFQKPRAEQIKGAMMSVCFKEGIKIEPSALMEMIIASGQDVRQVLHNLSLWGAGDRLLSSETARESARNTQKHSKKNPFDVVRLVFAPRDGEREFSLSEKSDLFFHDYSIASLFVQENYLSAKPASARGDPRATLKCMSRAADSLCDGDLVEKQIRRTNQWNLLPTQAFFSSVIPGEAMKGFLGKPEFPRWLGQNSKQSKTDRLLQQLKRHAHLMTSCTKTEFGLEYLPFLSSKLIQPLLDKGSEGVSDVVSTMSSYDLLKDDWDSIQELAHFNGRPDRVSQIPTKVKSQFTRTYNKEKHLSHYATESKVKRRTTGDSDSLQGDDEGEAASDHESEERIDSNPMIKVKKEPSKKGKNGESSNGSGTKKAKPSRKKKK